MKKKRQTFLDKNFKEVMNNMFIELSHINPKEPHKQLALFLQFYHNLARYKRGFPKKEVNAINDSQRQSLDGMTEWKKIDYKRMLEILFNNSRKHKFKIKVSYKQ